MSEAVESFLNKTTLQEKLCELVVEEENQVLCFAPVSRKARN